MSLWPFAMWTPRWAKSHCHFRFWFYSLNISILLVLATILVFPEWNRAAEQTDTSDIDTGPSPVLAPGGWEEGGGGGGGGGQGLSEKELRTLGMNSDKPLAAESGVRKTAGGVSSTTNGRRVYSSSGSILFPGRKLIIYTMFRSGSSFLADIVAHQPGVYYMFEPLQTYSPAVDGNDAAAKVRKARRVAERGAHFLQQLLSCNLVPFIRDVMEFGRDGRRRVATWGRRVFCRDYQRDQVAFLRDCDPLRLDRIPMDCNDHQTVLIKEVVLHNLTALVPLMEKGVKVIHLFRDPRAQLNSIRRLPGGLKMTSAEWTDSICTILKQDIEATRHIQGLSSAIRNNYLRVRYEDLTNDPFRVADKLFAFAGLLMHKKVRKWLGTATTTRSGKAWSTMRVSNETSVAWRGQLNFNVVQWVQERCSDTMGVLGYVKVNTVEELVNTNISLLQPLMKLLPLSKVSSVFRHYPF